jgi:hypothetical protein
MVVFSTTPTRKFKFRGYAWPLRENIDFLGGSLLSATSRKIRKWKNAPKSLTCFKKKTLVTLGQAADSRNPALNNVFGPKNHQKSAQKWVKIEDVAGSRILGNFATFFGGPNSLFGDSSQNGFQNPAQIPLGAKNAKNFAELGFFDFFELIYCLDIRSPTPKNSPF